MGADRQHILVSSNQSGIYNAYVVPLASGPLQPLTQSTTNSVFAISYFPADERILYSSDQGGNELTHLYVRATDGSATDITPGTKLKANFERWAGDDKSFFISTNERDPRYFDLYQVTTDGFKRTLLYRNTSGLEIGPSPVTASTSRSAKTTRRRTPTFCSSTSPPALPRTSRRTPAP